MCRGISCRPPGEARYRHQGPADQFERLCCWYLLTAPEYRLLVKQVWLWDDWPGRWGADAGIDLVAETVTGEAWAIQAKAYSPSYAIKKADVDSFLSESARPQFAFRLLIASTDLLGATARRTLADQEKPAGQRLRSQLEAAKVEWPDSFDDLKATHQQPKSPRPHQQEAIEALCAGFDGHDRGQLVMACGTGKTLVALWAAERLESRLTLVLLPSLLLLDLRCVSGRRTRGSASPTSLSAPTRERRKRTRS